MGLGQFVFLRAVAQARQGQLPEEAFAAAACLDQAELELLHRRLEAVLAQLGQGFLQGDIPSRKAVALAGYGGVVADWGLHVWHHMGAEPGAGLRVGEGAAVVEAQFFQAAHALHK